MDLLINEYFNFFLIIALGMILGNIRIKGISLASGGIIFVALAFGHFGFKVPGLIQSIGLILFIYSVGIAAGPGFIRSVKEQGIKFFVLAFAVVFAGAVLALGFARLFDTDVNLMVGIFTGALTSTPGLAASIEASGSSMPSIGYGIAYPFGVLGVILFIRLAPKIFKVDLKDSEKDYETELLKENPLLMHRNFTVENPNIIGKSIGELKIRSMTNANVSRVFQNGVTIVPNSETMLQKGDIVKAVGTEESLEKIRLLIGEVTDREIPLSSEYTVSTVLVSNTAVANKTFSQLNLFDNYGATATRIRRAGIDLTPRASTRLQLGDKVIIACPQNSLTEVENLLGHTGKTLSLDLLPIAIGIILGILIGKIEIPVFGIQFSLGLTGGVLLASLILSKIGRTGPLVWNVSGDINQFLRKIGLVFFLIGVGTHAGEKLYETILTNGLQLFGFGVVLTIVPMLIAVFVGKYILKMNFLLFLGALSGAMTSTPALSALDPMTESEAPKVGYAAIYPFALVLVIIFSQLLCLLQ